MRPKEHQGSGQRSGVEPQRGPGTATQSTAQTRLPGSAPATGELGRGCRACSVAAKGERSYLSWFALEWHGEDETLSRLEHDSFCIRHALVLAKPTNGEPIFEAGPSDPPVPALCQALA